jgi:hypothetical protein
MPPGVPLGTKADDLDGLLVHGHLVADAEHGAVGQPHAGRSGPPTLDDRYRHHGAFVALGPDGNDLSRGGGG